jgi:squalene-associated FAD-dependent desaturase
VKQLTVIGAGWAGLAAAVAASQAGWRVTLFEASAEVGGRARRLPQRFADQPLDNGQHILIGAYRDTLDLMRTVGLDPDALLQRIPLDLRLPNSEGLVLPDWPMPFNLLAGLARAKGWTLNDKARLVQAAWRWQRAKFECPSAWTVTQLCEEAHITPRVVSQLIEPLCLSALNTSLLEASAKVFLRVLQDALLSGTASSDLLLPRVDLGALMPDACLRWLKTQGADIHIGQRVTANMLQALHQQASAQHVTLLACPAWEAARLTTHIAPSWSNTCTEIRHNPIATVYLQCHDKNFMGLERPMMGLQCEAQAPAQFVFDRGQLNQQSGLLAAVVSACTLERDEVTEQVRTQVREQLKLTDLTVVQTVIEKRATLACTPLLERPVPRVADGLWACGDYLSGPYPSTLEGAIRSGQQVVTQISQMAHRQRLR